MTDLYEIDWSESGLAADDEKVAHWLKNPLYRKLLILSYIIYEPIRIIITSAATVVLAFLTMPLLTKLAMRFQSSSQRSLLPAGYTVTAEIPEGISQMQAGLFFFVLSLALFIIVIELVISTYTEHHRPLSYIAIILTYGLILSLAHTYSLLRNGRMYDTANFRTFKKELIEENSSPPMLVYYLLSNTMKDRGIIQD